MNFFDDDICVLLLIIILTGLGKIIFHSMILNLKNMTRALDYRFLYRMFF